MLNQIIQSESSGEAEKAEQRMDRETLEKLKSLGYLASSPGVLKDKFTPGDDVKRMLPYHNKAMDGLDLYRSGKVREGIEALKEVITDKKNVSTAYLNLAFIYRSQGRPADATSVLKMGLAALPENYDIYSQYLTYLYEAGQVDEVIRVFETMRLPQTEFNPVIWNYAGLACWKKGDDKKAQEYYEKSLAIDEKFAIPYANLGNLHYFRFKRTTDAASYRKAVECYQKSIALDPAYSAAYHGLGVTYLQGGNTALAIVNLEKALELEPEVGKIFYFLWVSYLQAGNRDKACFYLMKFKSSPDYDSLSSQEKADLEKAIANCQKKS
jgi:Tfp pilus assembly protein PilF